MRAHVTACWLRLSWAPRVLRVALFVALFIACAIRGARAQEEPRQDELRFEDVVRVASQKDPCLSDAALRQSVRRHLARGKPLAPVRVTVVVDDGDDALPYLVVERDGQVVGERRFESLPRACGARRDAIAIAIALAIEGEHVSEEDAQGDPARNPSPAFEPERPAAPAPEPARALPPEAAGPADTVVAQHGPADDTGADARRDGWDLALHAGAGLALGLLPRAGAVLAAGVELAPPGSDFAWVMSALASLPSELAVGGGRVRSQMLGGRGLLCWSARRAQDAGRQRALSLHACAGPMAGALIASGRGYAQERSTSAAWLAVTARAALLVRLSGPLGLQLSADGWVNAVRPELRLRAAPGAAERRLGPGPLGAALSAELRLSLP